MTEQTFCHIRGIGPTREAAFWRSGCTRWSEWTDPPPVRIPAGRASAIAAELRRSAAALARGDARYFADRLAARDAWRLFLEFQSRAGYLDIETNAAGTEVTAVALSDGRDVATYLNGRNLRDLEEHLRTFDLLITYNGACFDLPVLRDRLGVRFEGAHIDLRYVLRAAGSRGGLKQSERDFGLDRGLLTGLDGFAAVLLWDDYRATSDEKVLETFLAYNVEDVRTLPLLMTACYNRLLPDLPFAGGLQLPTPELLRNPYRADAAVVEGILARLAAFQRPGAFGVSPMTVASRSVA